MRSVIRIYPEYWPQYISALSYIITSNYCSEENKLFYTEVIRNYLTENNSDGGAASFSRVLEYWYTYKRDSRFYYELQELTSRYYNNREVASSFVSAACKEASGASAEKLEILAIEITDLCCEIAMNYCGDCSIMYNICGLILSFFKVKNECLKKSMLKKFEKALIKTKPYYPYIIRVYYFIVLDMTSEYASLEAKVLITKKFIFFYLEADQLSSKDDYLYRLIRKNCLNTENLNDRFLFINEIINVIIRFEICNARKNEILSYLAAKLLEPINFGGSKRNYFNLMSLQITVFNYLSQEIINYNNDIQREVSYKNLSYDEIPQMMENFILTAISYYSFLPYRTCEKSVQNLSRKLVPIRSIITYHSMSEVYRLLISAYLPRSESINIENIFPTQLFTLEKNFLNTWNLVRCDLRLMIAMSHKILKRHFSMELLQAYISWLFNTIKDTKDIERLKILVREAETYLRKFRINHEAVLARVYLLALAGSREWQLKLLFKKARRLLKYSKDPEVLQTYRHALTNRIISRTGKHRLHFIRLYITKMAVWPEVFTRKRFLCLMVCLANLYPCSRQDYYLAEIIKMKVRSAEIEEATIVSEFISSSNNIEPDRLLLFCNSLIAGDLENGLAECVLSALTKRNSNVKELEKYIFWFLTLINEASNFKLSLSKRGRMALSTAISQLLSKVIQSAQNWPYLNSCICRHLDWLDCMRYDISLRELLKTLLLIIDQFNDLEIKERYITYLNTLSKKWPVKVYTDLDGKLIAQYYSYSYCTKKPVEIK